MTYYRRLRFMVAGYPYQTDKNRLETVVSLGLDLLGTRQVVRVARVQTPDTTNWWQRWD
jgi:hypothetical protein